MEKVFLCERHHRHASRFSRVQLLATPWTGAYQAWDSPGTNTGVGCHFLLQGIFPTQGSNQNLLSPALADRFFTTSATWEVLGTGTKCRVTLARSDDLPEPLGDTLPLGEQNLGVLGNHPQRYVLLPLNSPIL